MLAGWDKAILERVINYRMGFSEPLLICVVFSFLPFVTTEGFETIGGGHACIMACREGLDTLVSLPPGGSTLCPADYSTGQLFL